MHVDPSDLSAQESYRLLTGIVVPRPIAWVSTLSGTGGVNLAPFSTFTFVAPKPPMVGFSVGRKGSTYKDTARNILTRETYVVHIADRGLMEPLHESAEEVAPEVSEAEMLGLETLPSDCIEVPRLAAAPVAMECRLRQVLEFGDTRSRFLVGEVLRIHIRDGLVRDGKIDSAELDPICRLAGPNYATLGEIRTLRAMQQTKKHSGA
ncbi:flavin reductase family protein [Oceanicola sp. S124]|uniref:flavin reductase family protein n=1 Tax=Oceanicola sp. S124 TaxID=1042378 RepID=UPI0002557D01|nr:flavin reductase family protein [Oceanicola sp. S124]